MRFGFYVNRATGLRGVASRKTIEPAVIAALAEAAGTQVLLAGWSPNNGSLAERDFKLLRELLQGDLVLIIPLGSEHVDTVVRMRPSGVVMTTSGWDGASTPKTVATEVDSSELATTAAAFHSAGVTTAVLIEPEAAQVKNVARCGLNGVVLETSDYADAQTDTDAQAALDKLSDASLAANKFGLFTAAFGGINYRNVGPVAELRFMEEIYVGSSVLSRALMIGIDRAVVEMIAAIHRGG